MNYAGFSEFEIVIVTLIFSDVVPQLNSHSLFPALSRGNLSVALLHFVIHCSVFKVHPLTTLAIRLEDPIPWILKSNNKRCLVGPSGLEPPTLRLSVARSSQLSYGPSSMQAPYPSLPPGGESSLISLHLLFDFQTFHWFENRVWTGDTLWWR